MTTGSSSQTYSGHHIAPHHAQDADWVLVKEDAYIDNGEDFELIHAAEARCWCGGADPERCRLRGHRWPLCDIDRDGLWPREEIDSVGCSAGDDDESDCGRSSSADDDDSEEESTRDPTSEGVQPGFYEGGPFTSLAVLTALLDSGRYSDK